MYLYKLCIGSTNRRHLLIYEFYCFATFFCKNFGDYLKMVSECIQRTLYFPRMFYNRPRLFVLSSYFFQVSDVAITWLSHLARSWKSGESWLSFLVEIHSFIEVKFTILLKQMNKEEGNNRDVWFSLR